MGVTGAGGAGPLEGVIRSEKCSLRTLSLLPTHPHSVLFPPRWQGPRLSLLVARALPRPGKGCKVLSSIRQRRGKGSRKGTAATYPILGQKA